MAYNSLGFWLTLSLIDKAAKETTMRVQMEAAAYAGVITDAAYVLAAIMAVTDATLKSYTVAEVFDNDAWAYPAGDCSVADRAILTLKIAGGGNKVASLSIPAPSITIFVGAEGPNRDVVDSGDSAVQDLVTIFSDPAKISDGEQTLSYANGGFLAGRRSNRKYRSN